MQQCEEDKKLIDITASPVKTPHVQKTAISFEVAADKSEQREASTMYSFYSSNFLLDSIQANSASATKVTAHSRREMLSGKYMKRSRKEEFCRRNWVRCCSE